MDLSLEKEDLINLVMGTSPSYEAIGNPIVDKSGHYTGGFHDKWTWDSYKLEKFTEEELFDIYLTCKNN